MSNIADSQRVVNRSKGGFGANPFGGYSHQTADRDLAMRTYYTVARIKETWGRAEAAGINTMVTNNETPHVLQAVREYLSTGGSLQWIAQVTLREKHAMVQAIDEAVEIGCNALYFHRLLDQGNRSLMNGTPGPLPLVSLAR